MDNFNYPPYTNELGRGAIMEPTNCERPRWRELKMDTSTKQKKKSKNMKNTK